MSTTPYDAGLDVLRWWAATGERFSANDCRAALAAVGVTGPQTGALFTAAIKAGLIVPVGWVRTTEAATHRKQIARYLGAQFPLATQREAVTVPVVRDPRGKFTRPAADDAPTLFEVSA